MRTPADVLRDRLRALLHDTASAREGLRNLPEPLADRLGQRVEQRGAELREELLELQRLGKGELTQEIWADLHALSLEVDSFAQCYVAGAGGAAVHETLASEFNTQVRPVALRDFVEDPPSETYGLDAELTACSGVFTG